MTPLEAVAARAAALPRGARIAVDGVSASGKTTFADALAVLVGGDVARVSLDAFLAPAPREVYYPHAFDFAAFRAHLESLDPYQTVIADGLFLHHPDLRDLWTLSVYLHCDASVAMERGVARDASWMENARERYATRYVPEDTATSPRSTPRPVQTWSSTPLTCGDLSWCQTPGESSRTVPKP